jgi:chitinase
MNKETNRPVLASPSPARLKGSLFGFSGLMAAALLGGLLLGSPTIFGQQKATESKDPKGLTDPKESTVQKVPAEQKEKVGWVTGYWTGWARITPKEVVWKAYTHMCIFSATPGAGGACNLAMGWNDSRVKAAVAEGHKNHVKMILCVGGAGTGKNFVTATADATIRATFIKNIIALMKNYEFDGVDMDWEEIGGKQDQYVAVHKELRAELDKITPRPLLTVAIANWMFNKQMAAIHPYMDQMNNMSYWTKVVNNGVVDEAAIAKDMQGLVDKGLPKAKLGVGIGLDYEEGHAEVDCDPAACTAKCRFAIAKGYGGVMVWAFDKDLKKNSGKQPCHDALAAFTPIAPKPQEPAAASTPTSKPTPTTAPTPTVAPTPTSQTKSPIN